MGSVTYESALQPNKGYTVYRLDITNKEYQKQYQCYVQT